MPRWTSTTSSGTTRGVSWTDLPSDHLKLKRGAFSPSTDEIDRDCWVKLAAACEKADSRICLLLLVTAFQRKSHLHWKWTWPFWPFRDTRRWCFARSLMPQAKEGDNTTSQPWSVQWETKAKWEAHPGTAYSGSLCGMGMVSDSWWQLVSCLEFLNVVEFWNQVWLLLWTMFNYVDLVSWVKHGKTIVNHPFGHGFYHMDGLWHRFTNISLSISHPCYDDPPGMGEVQRKVEGNG